MALTSFGLYAWPWHYGEPKRADARELPGEIAFRSLMRLGNGELDRSLKAAASILFDAAPLMAIEKIDRHMHVQSSQCRGGL
jgi:hypothetical protein